MKPGWMLGLSIAAVAGLTVLVVFLVQGIPTPIDAYKPRSEDGRIIYLEACAKCHGASGAGTALAPSLKVRRLPPRRVRERIQAGTGRMPKFPNINGDALDKLINYINKIE